MPFDQWISERSKGFDSSGIRRMFDLAAKLENPINLSIGQPDFDVPEEVRSALVDAVQSGKNGYAQTQGLPALREKLQAEVDADFGHDDRQVFVASGTSGGLFLAVLSMVNPGDEVIYFDPYFVMYPAMLEMAGGVSVPIDIGPDFKIDIDKLESTITDKTKMIILNSPANPTGVCASEQEIKAVAELAYRRGICLVSDEIYSKFTFDQPHVSAAKYNPDTIVIDGFSKSYAMTGLRVGYVHGPSVLVQNMLKFQQYTFVCAPQPAQWAAVVAMDTDISHLVKQYQAKRDRMLEGLKDHYEIVKPGGAFYIYPKLPWGTGEEFVAEAINNNLMVIPGNIFSENDTHFRISYAAADEVLDQGIAVLQKIARRS
jgi:aspartate aminotransferase/aminotransferase